MIRKIDLNEYVRISQDPTSETRVSCDQWAIYMYSTVYILPYYHHHYGLQSNNWYHHYTGSIQSTDCSLIITRTIELKPWQSKNITKESLKYGWLKNAWMLKERVNEKLNNENSGNWAPRYSLKSKLFDLRFASVIYLFEAKMNTILVDQSSIFYICNWPCRRWRSNSRHNPAQYCNARAPIVETTATRDLGRVTPINLCKSCE